jgi:uncharacterized repeat protein (TIGR04052 family)
MHGIIFAASHTRRGGVAGLLTVIMLCLGTESAVAQNHGGPPDRAVTINFVGAVGDEAFVCGRSYAGLGRTGSTVTPSDFRFYVSEIHLLTPGGQAVPVRLEQDGIWQYENVALLDFEDRTGPCLTGTPETRGVVVGRVPKGQYRGLRFTLGVPFALNHADATIAPSPLNLTSLFWSWQSGYKFVRIDLATVGRPQTIVPGMVPRFGDLEGSQVLGFAIHLGSTMCAAEGATRPPSGCRNPNRPTITLPDFDPDRDVVVADLKRLLDGVDVDTNQPGSPAGCMSTPTDADCNPLMRNFGLPFGAEPAGPQRFFRVR